MNRRKEFGAYLKLIREASNLTQREVAEAFKHSSPQFVSNIERGIAPMPEKDIPKYARLVGVKPRQILEKMYHCDFKFALQKMNRRRV